MVYDQTSGHFSPLITPSHPAFEAYDRHGPETGTKPPPRLDPPLPFYSASHVPDVPRPPPPKPYTGPLDADEDSDDEDRPFSQLSSSLPPGEAEQPWRGSSDRGHHHLGAEDSDGEEVIRGAGAFSTAAKRRAL